MEKYKNLVRMEEMKNLLSEGNYRRALEIAQQIDIRKLKKSSELNLVYDVYMRNSRYERARACVERLYSKVSTRKILMQLIEVCLKLHDVAAASQYQQEFISMAPDDFYRYIYQYNIDKLSGKPVEVLIESLEQLKNLEYIDIWAYELAKLYHKAGLRDKCMKECDDIVVWFGDGDIVDRAKALRAYYMGELELEGRGEEGGEGAEAEESAEAEEDAEAEEVAEAEEGAEAEESVEAEEAEGAEEAAEAEEISEAEEVAETEEAVGTEEFSEAEGFTEEEVTPDAEETTEAKEPIESEEPPAAEETDPFDITLISAEHADEPETPEEESPSNTDEDAPFEQTGEVQALPDDVVSYDAAEQEDEQDVSESEEPVDIKIDQEVIDGEDYDFSASLASAVGMFMDEEDASFAEESVEADTQMETVAQEPGTPAGPETQEPEIQEPKTQEPEVPAGPETQELEIQEPKTQEPEPEAEDAAEEPLSDREKAEIEVEQALTSMIEEETRIANGEDTSRLDLEKMFGSSPAPAEGSLLAKLLEENEFDASDLFGGFAFVEPVRSQIYKCMEMLLNPQYKNSSLIVSGASTRERTMISRAVVKTMYLADILEEQRIAKTTGIKARTSNILGGNEHIKKCGLMIDVAGGIDAETAKKLISFREVYGPGSLIILMDTKNELLRIFKEYDGLAATFTNRIHIPELGTEDLYRIALFELYFDGFDIERSAADALKERIRDKASAPDALSAVLGIVDGIRENIETGNAQQLIANALKGETLSGGSHTITRKDVG